MAVLLAPPGRSRLMHAEPFGPVDTIVIVDTEEELLAAMNASKVRWSRPARPGGHHR